jgi:hypothetical protein
MITYQLSKELPNEEPNGVIKFNDNIFIMWIPFDIENTDYQQYLTWVAEGNTPLPAENE